MNYVPTSFLLFELIQIVINVINNMINFLLKKTVILVCFKDNPKMKKNKGMWKMSISAYRGNIVCPINKRIIPNPYN
jgi:hypothetical protein